MQVDATITFSAVLGLAAVIAPCITAYFNMRSEVKLKSMELKFENYKLCNIEAADQIERFIPCLLTFASTYASSPSEVEEYIQNLASVLPYIPQDLWDCVSVEAVQSKGFDPMPVVEKLSSEIRRLKTSPIQ